jgi:predicted small secreted protein
MRPQPLAAALLASLLLTGCGAGRTVQVAGHRLALTLEEYRILPRTVSVPAGPLRITACNRGVLTHNVALQRGSLDSDERTTLTDIPTLLPGRCGSVLTQPLAAGRYLLASTVGNQAVLGMAATLVVR